MDINAMTVFAKVVEANGYSQAARITGLPKSTISRKISLLEEELGVRLLHRNNRGLSLTHTGELFYQHCQAIAREIDEAQATIDNSREELSGHLRIALPVSLDQQTFAKLCSQFLQQHPKVNLDLQFSDKKINLVAEGYDIVIQYGPLENSDLIARPLLKRERILIASPAYLKKHGHPTMPHQLSEHDGLLLGTAQASSIWAIGEGVTRVMTSFTPKIRTNSTDTIKAMALSGLGIAILSRRLCTVELAKGELIHLLPDWPIEPIQLYGLYQGRRQPASKISRFLDYCVSYFSKLES